MSSYNQFASNNDFDLELDESTIDFVTSYSSYSFKSPPSLSPSSHSSIEASPSSNTAWNLEPADDSGLEATNMSCCTNYPASNFSNSNTNLNTAIESSDGISNFNLSSSGTVNSHLMLPATSLTAGLHPRHQLQHQHQQPTQQIVSINRPMLQRSSSLFSTESGSTFMSDSSSGFRTHSNSFGSGQRPIANHCSRDCQDGTSAGPFVAGQTSASVHQEETEATLFEFPTPNQIPIQVDHISSRTDNRDVNTKQQQPMAQQPELRMLSQPSRNHRARYRTEGSRGAIKDRTGRSFPVIKLYGYNLTAVKVRCFIGHDKKPGEAHLYYQVSRIIGKNITPCTISKVEGIKVIELELLPENDMQAVINCIGIVKERNFDVQRKSCTAKRKGCSNGDQESVSLGSSSTGSPPVGAKNMATCSESSSQLMKRSTTCNLVFTAFLPGLNQTVQVISETINCAQILGSPEIHKISATRDVMNGGSEVFVIGKNFTRDSKIVWNFLPQHKFDHLMMPGSLNVNNIGNSYSKVDQNRWIRETDPENEFINQNHLIFRVPPLKTLTHDSDGNEIFPINGYTNSMVPVTLSIRCGEKCSDPIIFAFVDPGMQQPQKMTDMNGLFCYT